MIRPSSEERKTLARKKNCFIHSDIVVKTNNINAEWPVFNRFSRKILIALKEENFELLETLVTNADTERAKLKEECYVFQKWVSSLQRDA